jgi:hypothetical protein
MVFLALQAPESTIAETCVKGARWKVQHRAQRPNLTAVVVKRRSMQLYFAGTRDAV